MNETGIVKSPSPDIAIVQAQGRDPDQVYQETKAARMAMQSVREEQDIRGQMRLRPSVRANLIATLKSARGYLEAENTEAPCQLP
jgi:hypothetical protein